MTAALDELGAAAAAVDIEIDLCLRSHPTPDNHPVVTSCVHQQSLGVVLQPHSLPPESPFHCTPVFGFGVISGHLVMALGVI
jgi:hypothetical protein